MQNGCKVMHVMVEVPMGLQVPTSHSHDASGVLLQEHISSTGTNQQEVHSLCTGIPACLDRHDCVNSSYRPCVRVCVCIVHSLKRLINSTDSDPLVSSIITLQV